MANITVTVKLDQKRAESDVLAVVQGAIPDVAERLLRDANFYVRRQTGATEYSSYTDSSTEDGKLRWTTPYSLDIYYNGVPATNENPNARLEWVDVAAEQNIQNYVDIVQKALDKK